jgi:hypothetical protein
MPSSGNNILDFGRVVYVEPNNDINGAGKGTKNMIFMTFGTGLGAGLILNGKLYS